MRDERVNPAGGIRRFVDSHVPYVEEAIILDTGSVDGTYEELKELQNKYSNLVVPEPIKFEGYADARNKSLEYATKDWTLILDADELITHKTPENNFLKLENLIDLGKLEKYTFDFLDIYNDWECICLNCHPLRLFRTNLELSFGGLMGEMINSYVSYRDSNIPVLHFKGSLFGNQLKNEKWYNQLWGKIKNNLPPSKANGFSEWKKYNPKRDDYE